MSKNLKYLYLFLCICLLSILFTGIYFSEKEIIADTYTIKEYDGKIAVYKNGDSVPERFLDTELSCLPQTDREKLKNGIKVSSEAELHRLIEDFSG